MNIEIFSALTLGFIGSMHCLGMCGPIALVIPLNRSSNATMISGALSYNLGRIITYSFLGALLGLIGMSFALGGYQRSVSIGLGALIIISAFLPGLVTKYFNIIPFVAKGTYFLKNSLSGYIKRKSILSLFVIGVLNGFLPCGLVYVAIAGAIISGSVLSGAVYMAAFGVGTAPTMFALPMLGRFISDDFRKKVMKVFPYVLILFGVLFILRGLNLGIPFISPVI